ncbi:uncharacterized protein BX664DRAFT_319276 [Halteromyces radiatus]|uniref:uncharacterized protein n=1 Tax=Halteromyces radiatus TaxID=101107 RepID=UPI0022210798|nr:uncharacterized protein BX664DRAFT_319276 [Halteromyces radiatus]KAI8098652.1 hypothetical protein BX664DRAFT_319276 [Halteromyces radiatus]
MYASLSSTFALVASLLATSQLVSSTSTHNWWDTPNNFGNISQIESSIRVPQGSDPTNTYWMANGWDGGYMGMQHNSGTERRILFAVWDDGNGSQVKGIKKGKNVLVEGFGGEGTGSHARYLYNWTTGETVYFRVSAKVNYASRYTDYTGYWRAEGVNNNKWNLVATFRAFDITKWLSGVYGFLENFGGDRSEIREGFYGNFTIKNVAGKVNKPSGVTYSHTTPEADSNYEYKFVNGESYMRTDGPKDQGIYPPTNPQ